MSSSKPDSLAFAESGSSSVVPSPPEGEARHPLSAATPPTVAIIGAGSAVFSLGLIRDLCLTERLHGCTVRLMDIDERRLAAIARLCQRYSDEQGAGITVEATTERCAA
ncbi:MAG: hypothetical protein JNM64_08615, partial [Chloroflexia bacterium]|nr:hypothetical protein [Chloroflexia bacterium]